MNKYRISYHDENTGVMKFKVIAAKTATGALCIFKRTTGIKGIVAKYLPTKEEKKQLSDIHTGGVDRDGWEYDNARAN